MTISGRLFLFAALWLGLAGSYADAIRAHRSGHRSGFHPCFVRIPHAAFGMSCFQITINDDSPQKHQNKSDFPGQKRHSFCAWHAAHPAGPREKPRRERRLSFDPCKSLAAFWTFLLRALGPLGPLGLELSFCRKTFSLPTGHSNGVILKAG